MNQSGRSGITIKSLTHFACRHAGTLLTTPSHKKSSRNTKNKIECSKLRSEKRALHNCVYCEVKDHEPSEWEEWDFNQITNALRLQTRRNSVDDSKSEEIFKETQETKSSAPNSGVKNVLCIIAFTVNSKTTSRMTTSFLFHLKRARNCLAYRLSKWIVLSDP